MKLGPEPALSVFPRNQLDRAGIDLLKAPVDLPAPRLFSVLVYLGIQTLKERVDQSGPLLLRQKALPSADRRLPSACFDYMATAGGFRGPRLRAEALQAHVRLPRSESEYPCDPASVLFRQFPVFGAPQIVREQNRGAVQIGAVVDRFV